VYEQLKTRIERHFVVDPTVSAIFAGGITRDLLFSLSLSRRPFTRAKIAYFSAINIHLKLFVLSGSYVFREAALG
jgi:hypothetical protein